MLGEPEQRLRTQLDARPTLRRIVDRMRAARRTGEVGGCKPVQPLQIVPPDQPAQRVGQVARRDRIQPTPAGQQRRVVTMSDTQVLGFGPRTGEVLNALGVALYSPDAL